MTGVVVQGLQRFAPNGWLTEHVHRSAVVGAVEVEAVAVVVIFVVVEVDAAAVVEFVVVEFVVEFVVVAIAVVVFVVGEIVAAVDCHTYLFQMHRSLSLAMDTQQQQQQLPIDSQCEREHSGHNLVDSSMSLAAVVVVVGVVVAYIQLGMKHRRLSRRDFQFPSRLHKAPA
jgi:uncharacterized membrane protein YciS (DUF1049 family)